MIRSHRNPIRTLLAFATLGVVLAACGPTPSLCPPELGNRVRLGTLEPRPGVRIRFEIFRTDLGSLFICFPEAGPTQLSGSRGIRRPGTDERIIVVVLAERDGNLVIEVRTETDNGSLFRDTFDFEGNLVGSEEIG